MLPTNQPTPATPVTPVTNKRRMTPDAIVSIVLVLVAVVVNLGVSFAGFMLVMMSDSCSTSCNTELLGGGVAFASISPSVLTIIGIIITIRLVLRGTLAFWVPLVTMAAQVIAVIIGALMVFSASGATF